MRPATNEHSETTITVVLSGNLRRYAGYERTCEVTAPTVTAALDALVERHSALRTVLLDGDGTVRSVHRLSLDGEVIDRREVGQNLNGSKELFILTALAGG